MRYEQVDSKSYNRGYIDGLVAAMWAGIVAGVLFPILAVAIYYMAGR
jgi:tetrahydromethanopterin S-methyltransferase subunit F